VSTVYADWCGPCKQIAPVYEELAKSLQGFNFIKFVKIDTEAQKDIAATYQVTVLPTFIVFRDGKVLEKVQGADPRKLQSIVKKIVSEIEEVGKKGGKTGESSGSGSGSSGVQWKGAEIPRGYSDVTDQIEIQRCDMLNYDPEAGGVRALFESSKPGALGAEGQAKDWVETDTDEQLMLFIPFQSMIKLHTLQVRPHIRTMPGRRALG
jgi:thioredoxin